MPSLKSSIKPVDPSRYKPVTMRPIATPIQSPGGPVMAPINAPQLPSHLLPLPVRISGLPSISTDVDGITRQFYTTNNLPQRRLILPAQ